MCGDFAVQMAQDTLREVVSFDLVLQSQSLHGLGPAPVAAHHAAHHTFMGKAGGAAAMAVSDAGGMNQRQIVGGAGFQKALFNGLVQGIGIHDAAAAAGDDNGIAVLDHCCRGFAGNHFRHVRSPFLQVKGIIVFAGKGLHKLSCKRFHF